MCCHCQSLNLIIYRHSYPSVLSISYITSYNSASQEMQKGFMGARGADYVGGFYHRREGTSLGTDWQREPEVAGGSYTCFVSNGKMCGYMVLP